MPQIVKVDPPRGLMQPLWDNGKVSLVASPTEGLFLKVRPEYNVGDPPPPLRWYWIDIAQS